MDFHNNRLYTLQANQTIQFPLQLSQPFPLLFFQARQDISSILI